ncbi:MAG: hypothetical protein JNM17_16815 [Archangium sp.]|nr:hypothetical protein [Archangium sp.]
MYRCEHCKEVVGPRIAINRTVVETRPVKYPVREKVNRARHPRTGRIIFVDDHGGEGHETVRELALCARCATAARSA